LTLAKVSFYQSVLVLGKKGEWTMLTGKMVLFGLFAGIFATVTMDVFAIVFYRTGLTVGAKGEWVGRWYVGMVRGRFVHPDITIAPREPGEKQAALAGHYLIGIILAVFYVAAAGRLGIKPDGFLPAVGYGLVTCVFPWFLVLPSLGFGMGGMKGPPELKLARSSLLNHISYGFGLWWTLNALPLGQ
jgi:hypothetical protein